MLNSLVGKDVHEANREHSTTPRVIFDDTFHPVFVIGSLVQHDKNFTFLELQLVIIVGVAVVEGATTFEPSLETEYRLKIQFNWEIKIKLT